MKVDSIALLASNSSSLEMELEIEFSPRLKRFFKFIDS